MTLGRSLAFPFSLSEAALFGILLEVRTQPCLLGPEEQLRQLVQQVTNGPKNVYSLLTQEKEEC
jgi:hypothetical protein